MKHSIKMVVERTGFLITPISVPVKVYATASIDGDTIQLEYTGQVRKDVIVYGYEVLYGRDKLLYAKDSWITLTDKEQEKAHKLFNSWHNKLKFWLLDLKDKFI